MKIYNNLYILFKMIAFNSKKINISYIKYIFKKLE